MTYCIHICSGHSEPNEVVVVKGTTENEVLRAKSNEKPSRKESVTQISELLNASLHKQTPSVSSYKGSDTVMASEVTLQTMKWYVDPILWDFITTLTQNTRAHDHVGISGMKLWRSFLVHKQSSSDSCICLAVMFCHCNCSYSRFSPALRNNPEKC